MIRWRLRKKPFYEIKGFETPIAIDVAGQRVTANFSVRRFASAGSDKDDSLEFGLTNVEASFGDGASNFVTLSGGKEHCYRCLMEWRFRLQEL